MIAQDFELTGTEHSVHFPRKGDDVLPLRDLLDRRFIILELQGSTIGDKEDLIGAIEMGLDCPYFGPGPHDDLTPNWDGLNDILYDTEWLAVRGIVVVIWESRETWRRLYEHCGMLIEVWLAIAAAQAANHGRPAHLVFMEEVFPPVHTTLSRGEHLRPFREVEAIRWMPADAIRTA